MIAPGELSFAGGFVHDQTRMTDPVPPITIGTARTVADDELTNLLRCAFVDEGYTSPVRARELFAPAAVRARGTILVARDAPSGELAGMIVLVPPASPGRRLAVAKEAELQLLAVEAKFRGHGLGAALVAAAVEAARTEGFVRLLLWTQPAMKAAQALYARAGFVRVPERDWAEGERRYLVFTRELEPGAKP